MSTSDSSDHEDSVHGSKKRKRNPKTWKNNQIKLARSLGQAYNTTAEKRVEAKSLDLRACKLIEP
jgi:hypothetical protein